MLKKQNYTLSALFLLAFAVRLLFYFFGAEIFYGKSDFYISGDTYSFVQPMINLVEHGIFTLDINNNNAAFSRLPGYSFVLLPFYLLFGSGKAFYLSVCFFQLLLDSISCLLVFQIVKKIYNKSKMAVLSAVLYALYPFIIVWNPVVYAETAGIFVMLLSLYLLVTNKHPVLIGALLCVGFYIRPQLLFLLPALLLALLLFKKQKFLKQSFLIILGFLLLYLPWPLRNYINHGEVVMMRDITGMRTWQNDVLYFHKYMNSLQAGWEPQMTQLIGKGEFTIPKGAYAVEGDSALLSKAIDLSRNCSDGFASFMNKPIQKSPCTKEVAGMWETLYLHQMKQRPFNYFAVVPFKGLMKGLFKFQLISNWKSPQRSTITTYLTSGVFLYRSILLLLGLFSIVHFWKRKQLHFIEGIIGLYFIFWYGWLCLVTRYLEMRYFLPVDVLLLIPAARLIASKIRFLNEPLPE